MRPSVIPYSFFAEWEQSCPVSLRTSYAPYTPVQLLTWLIGYQTRQMQIGQSTACFRDTDPIKLTPRPPALCKRTNCRSFGPSIRKKAITWAYKPSSTMHGYASEPRGCNDQDSRHLEGLLTDMHRVSSNLLPGMINKKVFDFSQR